MAKKKEKKKPIFEKVGVVFRSPVRADIMRQLSENPQRPTEIADGIGIQKQNLNYHLNALKRSGLIQTHAEEVTKEEIPKKKGTRVNGLTENGKMKVSYGVELTKNGKEIVNQFVNPLYEQHQPEEDGIYKNKIKEDKNNEK